MKNIINLFILSLSCILFAGCSDDDNKSDVIVSLVASTSNLEQPAMGGSGEIVLVATEGVSISSSADWCTYTLSGNTITFTTTYNQSIESRNATISIVRGEDQQFISIVQSGEVLSVSEERLVITRGGGKARVIVKCNVSYTVEPADSWISYSIENDSILTFDVENTDVNRKSTIKIHTTNNPSRIKTISLLQFTPAINELKGDWDFTYNDGNNTETAIVRLTTSGNVVIFNNFPFRYSSTGVTQLAAYFNNTTGDIYFPITQPGGTYNIGGTTYYAYLCVSDGQYLASQKTPTIQLPGIVEYNDPTNGFSYIFPEDNEAASGLTINSLYLGLFTTAMEKNAIGPDFKTYAGGQMYSNIKMKKR